jgi:hypothetical protein
VVLSLRPLFVTLARTLPPAAAMAGVLALFGTGDVAVPLLVAGAVAGTLVFAVGVLATGAIGRDEARALMRRLTPG